MFRRLARQVGLLLSALLVAVPGPAMALPSQAPRPPAPPRIVAIGDLHGDCSAWRDIARGRRADRCRTTAGPAARRSSSRPATSPTAGPDSLKIIRDLQRLQREAARAGGRVVVLVGNHEAMNVTGDLRYVHPGEYAAFADRDSAEPAGRASTPPTAKRSKPPRARTIPR